MKMRNANLNQGVLQKYQANQMISESTEPHLVVANDSSKEVCELVKKKTYLNSVEIENINWTP